MVGLGRRALGARCVLFALGVAFSSAVGGRAPSSQAAERTNRLAQETSPYLLLHAHNPVDWYPWGEAALQRAKQENKLIFLSIGYSSCHWCHVMERESFVDPEIAAFLNEHFICIKVDREERPDVDDIYMMAVQAITGRGGWPLSVFLTPDAKPFFGGTYFPARDGDREGAIGFLTILKRIHALWPARAELLQQDAERLTDLVKSQLATVPSPDPIVLGPDTMALIQQKLHDDFDPEFGGFGYDPLQPQRPKFPEPANLAFLVYRARTHQDAAALAMLELTLQKMGHGGIYDHVGGGFHRYATDRKWQIPHFEKMLYDNAQLLNIYAQAFALRPNPMYRQIVVETAECLRRDFLAPSGAYFAALDAESEGTEGRYYAWDRQEVERVIGADVYPLYAQRMGLDQPPNFETWHVLQGAIPVMDLAQQQNMSVEQLQAQLDGARQKLLLQRQQRVAPRLDNKILTAWNGLAIQGLANAGRLLDDPRYVGAARDAANFVWQHLRRDDGQLWHTHTAGKASLNAYLDDYAFYAQGLLALHAATHEPQWLARAEQIMVVQQELFADREGGGFFFTSAGHEQLIARGKQFLDGAVPAGNAIAAQNLAYLARLPDHEDQRQQAARLMQAASALWRNQPQGLPHLAIAWEMLAEKP